MAIASLRGNINGAGDNTALFLKTFYEVISAFYVKSEVWDFIEKKVISGAKTAQFIRTGILSDSNLDTHVLGEDYSISDLNQNEVTIPLDNRPTYFSTAFDSVDNYMAQYDKKSVLVEQVLSIFAKAMDKKVYCKVGEASETASQVTGVAGGVKITAATFGTDVESTLDTLDSIKSTAISRGYSESDLVVKVSPTLFMKLRRLLKDYIVSKDYSDNEMGFDKSVSKFYYGGLVVESSAHFGEIVGTNVTGVAGNTNYAYDFTNTVALAFTKRTVAALVAQDVKVSVTDLSGKNGLVYNSWIMQTGVGVLMAETAFQVVTA